MPTFFNTPDPKKTASATPDPTAPAFRAAPPAEEDASPQSQPAAPLSKDGNVAPVAGTAAPAAEDAAPAAEGAAPAAEGPAPAAEGPAPAAEDAAPAAEDAAPAAEDAAPAANSAANTAAPTPPPAFRAPPSDGAVIRHFRTAEAGALGKLRGDFDLDLSPALFERLKRYFSNTAKRDPTAGELRLLAALDSGAGQTPARVAVGELITDSAALAEVWADMMAKHGALHGVGSRRRNQKTTVAPPCTLSNALSLAGRYMARLHEPNVMRDMTVLASASDESAAIAAGLIPVAKLRVGEGFRSVWREDAPPLEPIPARAGDLLLYLPRVDYDRLAALLACLRKESRPVIGAIRAVTGTSLLASLWHICEAADLYPDRIRMNLFPQSAPTGRVPVSLLCDPAVPAEDGTADYLIRVPLKQANHLSELLKRIGLNAVVCGQVRANDRTVVYVRGTQGNTDIPAAELPGDVLRGMAAPVLRSYTLSEGNVAPAADRPSVAFLPSPIPGLDGLTPDGRETVALTVSDARVLTTPNRELLLSAAEITVRESGSGYAAAMEAVRAAVSPLWAQNIPNRRIALSVSLTATHPAALTMGVTLELLCGLYRAAAEGGLPIVDPAMEVTPASDASPGYRLTVVAYARDEAPAGKSAAVGTLPATSDPTAESARPRYLLPILRRPYENSLKALSAALSREGDAVCVIHPLIMSKVEVEIPAPAPAETATEATAETATEATAKATTEASAETATEASAETATEASAETATEASAETATEATAETATEASAPLKEIRHVPDPKSVEELAAKLTEEPTPVFSMSEADTRLLLEQVPIANALAERIAAGRPLAVLGESCKPFAELGLLPDALTELSAVTASASVTVEYRHGASPTRRLLRTPLLIPAGVGASDLPGLMTLRLPDGKEIPDGFTNGDGRVLGFLNGLDTALLPLLRRAPLDTDSLI